MPMMPWQMDMNGGQTIDLNSLSVQGQFSPICPVVVRQFGVSVLQDITAAGIVLLKRRPTAGSATGEVTISTINLLATHTQGQMVYEDGLNVLVSPGEELVCEVTNVTAATEVANATVWGEMSYEAPGNYASTAMIATT